MNSSESPSQSSNFHFYLPKKAFKMSAGPLIVDIIVAFILAAGLLYRYGNWQRHHFLVTLAVLISWYFSLLIVFVLPLDVSSTVYRQCVQSSESNSSSPHENSTTPCAEPWSSVPDNVYPNLWRIVYWTSQCLTWLVMPLMQSYAKAGEFTFRGKLKSAILDNAIYYGSYIFLCFLLLVYITFKPGLQLDGQKLKAIASSASNTWGLFLLVILLGYALVEIPRNLWLFGQRGYALHHAYFRAAKLNFDKSEAEETLDDVLESVQSVRNIIHPNDPLYPHLETIVEKIPPPIWQRLKNRHRVCDDGLDSPHSQGPCQITQAEWYWRCWMHPIVLKTAAIISAVLSTAVVWSEVTFFNKKPVLSIFAILVNLAKPNYDYFTIELLSTVIIAYLCLCAFATVLKIRVLNYYYLAPHHLTDEHSLVFSGMMLSRLTPPMCLNFLGLIHMDSHVIKSQLMETHYTQVMGHMDVISIISDGFNVYFPIAMLALCLATYFSVGSRILSVVGFPQFLGDDEVTTDLIDEGKKLIGCEKLRKQKTEESAERRREYLKRFDRSSNQDNRGSSNTSTVVDDSPSTNLLTAAEPIDWYHKPQFDVSASDEYQSSRIVNPPRNIFDDV
ncbi:unnamed protein product [Bemisia tabaci]|uniref:Uncharacterized protein n=1 Tax=Bemisia tabaci TaxID=7038 RepID=A0A9P0F401_BEMTA|nr:unnamed protein product [Bemisia tabaci]